jgi:hypothetical protein
MIIFSKVTSSGSPTWDVGLLSELLEKRNLIFTFDFHERHQTGRIKSKRGNSAGKGKNKKGAVQDV